MIGDLKITNDYAGINKVFAKLFDELGYVGIKYINQSEDIGNYSYAIFDNKYITQLTPEQQKEAKEIKRQCRGGK